MHDCLLTSILRADTIPAAVQALYLKGNEIATHTITHVGYPSADEIVGCRKWLVNATGIPESKIVGFRWANQQTVLQSCGGGPTGRVDHPCTLKNMAFAAPHALCCRAPFLLSNAATRQALATGGFLYDSSIPDTTPSPVSPDVTQRLWPFRMDNGIPQTCSVGRQGRADRLQLRVCLWPGQLAVAGQNCCLQACMAVWVRG
jgi:hypothetical protein